jgi:ATP-binding cassette subfamily B protein
MSERGNAPDKTKKDILKVAIRSFRSIFDAAKFRTSLFILLYVAVALLPFAVSYLNKQVIDEVVATLASNAEKLFSDQLIQFITLYIILELSISLIWAGIAFLERDLYYIYNRYFTFSFLKKSSDLDLYHYEDSSQNDLIQRAKDSYNHRPANLSFRLGNIVRDVVQIGGSITIIAFFSPFFFVVLLVTTLPSLFVNVKMANISWGMWDSKTETRRKYWALLNYLSSEKPLMELRIFQTKKFIYNEAVDLYDNFHNAEKGVARNSAFFDSITNVFAQLGTISFWIYIIYQVLNGDISIGALSFYTGTAAIFSRSLGNFFRNSARTYEDLKYMGDYYDFMDLKNTIKPGKEKLVLIDKKAPEIRFEHVDFAYPGSDKTILNNFELTIKPGERIAFVGENGAGKTTIVKLLTRFYDVTSGSIRINGTDLKDFDLDDWYKQVGVLFQDFNNYGFLPAKTNISIGRTEHINDIDRVIDASKKSGAHDFIKDLDKEYDQLLSKNFPDGVDLSGGQWQRIALARGFFRDAPILILDEPTSAIDAKGESEIFERLYEFSKGKTVIIISHRFSTVRMADKIYVVDKGAIVESGTHEELMKVDGKYADAFNTQAKGYK